MVTIPGGDDLLERDGEWAELQAALDDAGTGRGRLVVVEGQAGIGKTRLLGAAVQLAGEREYEVGRARGGSLEQEFAFGAVRQLLDPLVERASVQRSRLFDGAASAAAPIVGGHGVSSQSDAPGVVLHGLYWLTATLADAGAMLLLCDDVHWFDGPSLRYLAYLAHRLDEHPIALIVGTRPPGPGPEGELLTRLESGPSVRLLRPAPLSNDAVATLVDAGLEVPADRTFCDAVATTSRGNPFLVGELVRAARNADVAPRASNAVLLTEISAGSAVLGRLGRLPDDALELARAVTVLGVDAHVRHAAAMSGMDIDEAGAAADVLLRAGILGPERPLTFVHPLVATAVYNDLLPGDRAARHRRATRILADEHAPAERIAPHLLLTEPAGDRAVVETLAAAARAAAAHGATDVAITYLRRALQEPPPLDLRAGIVLELGAAEAFLTDPGAIDHLQEAIESLDDPTIRIMLATARGLAMCLAGRAKDAMESLSALRSTIGDDENLQLQLLAGTVLAGLTGPAATPLVTEQIADLRRRVGSDTDAPADVLGVRAFAGAFANEPADDMAALARRSLAAMSTDDPTLPIWFHLPVVTLIMTDHDDEAAQWIEKGLAVARRLGAPAHVAVTLFVRAWIAFRAGELSDADADARAAMEICEMHDVDFVLPGPLAILVEVLREQDDVATAEALLESYGYHTGDGDALFHLFLVYARARIRGAQGRWDDALAEIQRGSDLAAANGCHAPGLIAWQANEAFALAMGGRSVEARVRAREAVDVASAFGAPRAVAEALRALGMADPANEGAALDEALQIFDALAARLEVARTAAAIAMTRPGVSDHDRRELFRRALQSAEQCGAVRVATIARDGLRQVGGKPGTRPVVGVGALTKSERRVAVLAAAGSSNKQVAQELFVSVKTVETHLAHVYQKLGITSRVGLSAALSD